MPSSNACQLVFKYLLMNKDLFVKAFHNRVYSYSSGTKFAEVSDDLNDWLETAQKAMDAYAQDPEDREAPFDPVKAIKHVLDKDGLHGILGNTIIAFMRIKPTPYLKMPLLPKCTCGMSHSSNAL